jgi:hypothetical protein
MHKRNQNWRVWTGLIWFRIRTSGGLLWTYNKPSDSFLRG